MIDIRPATADDLPRIEQIYDAIHTAEETGTASVGWARGVYPTGLRIDTNAKNAAARRLYARLGFREAAIVPCTFNSIAGVELVCLEKRLDAE